MGAEAGWDQGLKPEEGGQRVLAESQASHDSSIPGPLNTWTQIMLPLCVHRAKHAEHSGNQSSEESRKASQDRVQGSYNPRGLLSQA